MISPPSAGCSALPSNPCSQIYLSTRGQQQRSPWNLPTGLTCQLWCSLCGLRFSLWVFRPWVFIFLCDRVVRFLSLLPSWGAMESGGENIFPYSTLKKSCQSLSWGCWMEAQSCSQKPRPQWASTDEEPVRGPSHPGHRVTGYPCPGLCFERERAHHVLGPDSPSAGKQHISHSLVLLHPPQHQF